MNFLLFLGHTSKIFYITAYNSSLILKEPTDNPSYNVTSLPGVKKPGISGDICDVNLPNTCQKYMDCKPISGLNSVFMCQCKSGYAIDKDRLCSKFK